MEQKNKSQWREAYSCLGCLASLPALAFVVVSVNSLYNAVFKNYGFLKTFDKEVYIYDNEYYFVFIVLLPALFVAFIASLIMTFKSSDFDEKLEKKDKEVALRMKEVEDYRASLNKQWQDECTKIQRRETGLYDLLYSTTPFKQCASMMADAETLILKDRISYFTRKSRPSPKSADEVRALKRQMTEIIKQLKEKEYKYDYLISVYPQLEEYVDDDDDLIAITQECASVSEIENLTRDPVSNYLTLDEWRSLSVDEKNQLALDRYIANRRKSKHQIGRDYEMACGYMYTLLGYKVFYQGIKFGLSDLGRDLIALRKIDGQDEELLIIQCKCWSKERPIRENVIMQLYGSTVQYSLEFNIKAKPILMIPPFTQLSEEAKKFARYLKIDIAIQEFSDFPRIKCNINGTDKIYHLPFDQQYNRTEITKPGEFYAWTVAQAVSKGFRRAYRHTFEK